MIVCEVFMLNNCQTTDNCDFLGKMTLGISCY